MLRIKLLFAGLAIALSFGNAAHAATINFDLTDPDSRNNIYNSTYAKQYNYQESGLNLSVTGWSYNSNKVVVQDWVGKWDGLGVEKVDSPNHAVDNENGDFDMLLLSFDKAVTLKSIDLGWISGDSDMSFMAFNGGGAFDSNSLLGKKWEMLIGNGWQSAGNYYNVDYGANSGTINHSNIISQYWLVGAYNNALGSFNNFNQNLSSKTDYFKVKGVGLELPPDSPPVRVPESGSLMLVLLGFAGLLLARRRKV
ncbi:exosortase-dependent surface protein XDP1 [Cellvibrio sp. NN19]|uniref:exosortase-dependent surface protein XDP1 n=1 Tax=Cellvibrio chitinivorans TaxID=3102792 RepID=UPI002B40C137|nr:exosortase-dependent surface protein XDP1 [Cellvibrio sp. NN19]